MDWPKLASQALAGNHSALKTMAACRKAYKTRLAIAKLYETHPQRAVAHVNAELDEASRSEERRQNLLLGLD